MGTTTAQEQTACCIEELVRTLRWEDNPTCTQTCEGTSMQVTLCLREAGSSKKSQTKQGFLCENRQVSKDAVDIAHPHLYRLAHAARLQMVLT